jgi:hypothetical protein
MKTASRGTLILLNGASSSGKTSIAGALQSLMQEPILQAGIDKFIFMLPSRYLDRPLWDDVLGRATSAGATVEGTDLRFRSKDHPALVDDGHMNMPGGEFFFSPIEESTGGVITYSEYPATLKLKC